jgi:hypothetical protein
MKNAVCTSTVDTTQQLWQRIQDAANEIRTIPGVFERVQSRSDIVLTHVFISMEGI